MQSFSSTKLGQESGKKSLQSLELGLQSHKKQPPQTTPLKDILLVSRQQPTLFRGKSQDLSALNKHSRTRQVDTLYDHYNLFKYGKQVMGHQIVKPRRGSLMGLKNSQGKGEANNPQIIDRKYKNGQWARQQSTQLKVRLGEIRNQRKGVFSQIRKFVNIPISQNVSKK